MGSLTHWKRSTAPRSKRRRGLELTQSLKGSQSRLEQMVVDRLELETSLPADKLRKSETGNPFMIVTVVSSVIINMLSLIFITLGVVNFAITTNK